MAPVAVRGLEAHDLVDLWDVFNDPENMVIGEYKIWFGAEFILWMAIQILGQLV